MASKRKTPRQYIDGFASKRSAMRKADSNGHVGVPATRKATPDGRISAQDVQLTTGATGAMVRTIMRAVPGVILTGTVGSDGIDRRTVSLPNTPEMRTLVVSGVIKAMSDGSAAGVALVRGPVESDATPDATPDTATA